MTKIQESNKLIAEFIGFTEEKNIGWYDNEMLMPDTIYEEQNGNCFNELLFDKSWDWLMPVYIKYWKLWDIQNSCNEIISFPEDLNLRYDDFIIGTISIESAFKFIVEFIKWYNKNK